MKLNMAMLEIIIKLIISLILLVMMFIIAAFLYSAKYWPNVYNYINANITIESVPKLSELNITVYEVDMDYTTEYFNTTNTDDYVDSSTLEPFDIDGEDFDEFFEARDKRNVPVETDYLELPKKNVIVDYYFEETSTRLMKDLIDESEMAVKDSRDVKIINLNGDTWRSLNIIEYDSVCNSELKEAKASSIFPWIAAIFIKNATNEQFDYYCDGAILSRNVILTAARCVLSPDAPVNPDNVIVIAGKRSLQAAGGNETVARVKYITVHENFTLTGDVDNDLSILVLEQQLEFSSYIYSACFGDSDNNIKDSITTSWKITGELTPIYFDQTKYETCKRISKSNNTFCATYGNDVALCPSYGGVYAAKQTDSSWHIHGIRTGDPTQRGVCFDKDVTYTNITNYLHWIRAIIALNKT